MKAFRAALSQLEVTAPVFKASLETYDKDLCFEASTVCQNVSDTDEIDVRMAKLHFFEQWGRGKYEINYPSAEASLLMDMQAYYLRFVKQHSPTKHPKNTALYKFVSDTRRYCANVVDADEAFYSLYKYLINNSAEDLESTNIHVQNGFKILEVLGNRYEKE